MFSRVAPVARRLATTVVPTTRRLTTAAAGVATNATRHGSVVFAAAAAAAAAVVYTSTERDNRAHALFGMASEEDVEKLSKSLDRVQVELSGKTNSAFVFIKPHACNEKVAALLREHMRKHGVRVTGEGVLTAATIDENQLIDTHYGAIAAKAVKLKPCELNVPSKGQAAFEKAFGEAWTDAVAAGKVYNAKDACAKLGINAEELDAKWSTLKRGTNLLKFGGGFYCGQVDGIYVMNGFYMSMRSDYTSGDAKIHYFTVQWPTDTLSWADFRGNVLGATDPSTAEKGSLRRTILEQWQSLDLASKPNVGENGVHASASPFEALAERMNWLGVQVDEDSFGRGLVASGVDADRIASWTTDPQVRHEGQLTSLFDLLEDLDADAVLSKVSDIHG